MTHCTGGPATTNKAISNDRLGFRLLSLCYLKWQATELKRSAAPRRDSAGKAMGHKPLRVSKILRAVPGGGPKLAAGDNDDLTPGQFKLIFWPPLAAPSASLLH